MPNSSPPRRATVSSVRRDSVSRRPRILSSSSPAWWPSVSLTSLKWSRSTSTRATRPPSRCSVRAASAARRKNSRLGSPVRGSCSAWCSWSAACRRSARVVHHEMSARTAYRPMRPTASRVMVRWVSAWTFAAIGSYGRCTSSTPIARPFDSATTGCTTRSTAEPERGPGGTIRASTRPADAARNVGPRTGSPPRTFPSSEKETVPSKVYNRSRTTDPWKTARSVADCKRSRSASLSPSDRSAPLSAGAIAICSITAAWARPWSRACPRPSWL